MTNKGSYLKSIKNQFAYYKLLGEKTIDQLSDDQLFWQMNSDSNSVAIIVNHLWGNMMSRWTNFLTSDGEKEWRKRDQEFEDVIKTRVQLAERWSAGWNRLFEALEELNEGNMDTTIYIRNQGHTIIEAINRQLAHYAYHVGQIVFIGKMLKGNDWVSLSIPKGKSQEFNQKKFAKTKHKEHFTDEFLEEN